VWLNVRDNDLPSYANVIVGQLVWSEIANGWPFAFRLRGDSWDGERFGSKDVGQSSALAIDAAIAMMLLAVAAVAMEWLTPRMKRGKPWNASVFRKSHFKDALTTSYCDSFAYL
jgi:hypothetical protein